MKVGIQTLSKEDSIYNSALDCAIYYVDETIKNAQETLSPRSADLVIDYLYFIKENLYNYFKGADHKI